MYSIKTRVVGFFYYRVGPRKATCEYSKRHAFILLSHSLISSYLVTMVHGTWLMSGPCTVYLRRDHIRVGRIGRVHDDKKLQEMSVHRFKGFFSLIPVILSLFLCLLVKRKINRPRLNPFPKPCTLVCC